MKTAIVLHHSADSSREDQYEKVWNYHNNGAPRSNGTLKWPKGHGIQYAKFIERNGYIIAGRKEHEETWHAGRINYLSIAICLAGDFRTQNPTDAQVNTLVEIVNELKSRHPIQHIYNHYEVRPTTCPGMDLVGVYEREMLVRNLIPNKPIASKIRSLRRGIRRAIAPVKHLLEKQLSRFLGRVARLDHN